MFNVEFTEGFDGGNVVEAHLTSSFKAVDRMLRVIGSRLTLGYSPFFNMVRICDGSKVLIDFGSPRYYARVTTVTCGAGDADGRGNSNDGGNAIGNENENEKKKTISRMKNDKTKNDVMPRKKNRDGKPTEFQKAWLNERGVASFRFKTYREAENAMRRIKRAAAYDAMVKSRKKTESKNPETKKAAPAGGAKRVAVKPVTKSCVKKSAGAAKNVSRSGASACSGTSARSGAKKPTVKKPMFKGACKRK